MFWRNLLDYIKNWVSLIIIFIPLLVLMFINIDIEKFDENFEEFKDIVELLSWLFSGIVGLIGFSTLFLAFSYENKLVVASRELKRIQRPYSLSKDELRNYILGYQSSLAEDGVIKTVYRFFLFISSLIIFVWGSVLALYTKYQVSITPDYSLESFLIFGVYSFYLIIFISLFLILIATKLIRLNKDPLGKGFLLKTQELINLDYLKKYGDVSEVFFVNAPAIEIYKNPIRKDHNELNFHIPINISNFKFVITLHNDKNDILFKCYGKSQEKIEEDEIGNPWFYEVTENFPDDLLETLSFVGIYGLLKVYDNDNNVISGYLMTVKEDNLNIVIKVDRKLPHLIKVRENYGRVFENIQEKNRFIYWNQESK